MLRPPPSSTLFPYTTLFRSLRRVFVSGEALPAALRDRFHAVVNAELHNLYGPTEAAVDVTFWDAGKDDRSSDRKSTRLNSSHSQISYAVFCLKKKKSKATQH